MRNTRRNFVSLLFFIAMLSGCTGPALSLPANVTHPGAMLPGDEPALLPTGTGGYVSQAAVVRTPPPVITYQGVGN